MTKIIELYNNKPTVFSFEIFPPKTSAGEKNLKDTISAICEIEPDFISVTYGAGGSTHDKTYEWTKCIHKDYKITVMPHYTCLYANSSKIYQDFKQYKVDGIENVMMLRGDRPKEPTASLQKDFLYANEMISFIRSSNFDFCLGAACYPETHLEANSWQDDVSYLKQKVDAGADFLVSQLFFRNDLFFRFIDRCLRKNIDVPIVAGIMPLMNFQQISRFIEMTNCSFPRGLLSRLEHVKDDIVEFQKISLDYSTKQCQDIIEQGVQGIHLYTLNRSLLPIQIYKNIVNNKRNITPIDKKT